jgi:formamidopyrimidine-DNA glycosylase
MPELPEVETVANGVHERVRGTRILRVTLGPHKEPLKSSPAHIETTLTGGRIERVRRVGKTIVMDVKTHAGKAAQVTIHLGMTGRLLVSKSDVPMPPHTHVTLHLGDGRDVRFVDPRRFGRVGIVDEGTEYEGPGKEPLTISVDEFVALFKGRKTPIKSALLNQSLLHGVGNIYADESLFRAGIRPKRHAGRLTRAELTKLHSALQSVLKHAIQLGGSSVSDYVDADGVRGFFQLEHRVYSRTGEPCKDCGTVIEKITLGGRSTHFCKNCQK